MTGMGHRDHAPSTKKYAYRYCKMLQYERSRSFGKISSLATIPGLLACILSLVVVCHFVPWSFDGVLLSSMVAGGEFQWVSLWKSSVSFLLLDIFTNKLSFIFISDYSCKKGSKCDNFTHAQRSVYRSFLWPDLARPHVLTDRSIHTCLVVGRDQT